VQEYSETPENPVVKSELNKKESETKPLGSSCSNDLECETRNCHNGTCREPGYTDPLWFLIIGGVVFLVIGILVYYFAIKRKSESEELPHEPEQKLLQSSGSFPRELLEYYGNAEFIGEGGFARVFKAKRKTDGGIVVLKIPLAMNQNTGDLFLKEVMVWSGLNHKNIVKLYRANVHPLPYLEIEYVDGGSLDGIKKPIGLERASELVFDMLNGLEFAHSRNIFHLDLKPENVLLTSEGIPKITDWGLSKIEKHSKYSAVQGYTAMYSAPELVSSEDFGKADARTDIFQVGIIFYELVTGKNPYDADTKKQILNNFLIKNPVKPSALNPKAAGLDGIIMKCLEKEKRARYQSASELQKDVAEYLKIEYKKSRNTKKSCLLHARIVMNCVEKWNLINKLDTTEVLKCVRELEEYAKDDDVKDIKNIIKELVHRSENSLKTTDELINKIEVVADHIQMRWLK
jgi:serine/threonine protein kinase